MLGDRSSFRISSLLWMERLGPCLGHAGRSARRPEAASPSGGRAGGPAACADASLPSLLTGAVLGGRRCVRIPDSWRHPAHALASH